MGEPVASVADGHLGGMIVAIVSDGAEGAAALSAALTDMGLEVRTYAGADAALPCLSAPLAPALVIVDAGSSPSGTSTVPWAELSALAAARRVPLLVLPLAVVDERLAPTMRALAQGGAPPAVDAAWGHDPSSGRAHGMELPPEEICRALHSLVANTTDWVWQVDERAVYTYASPNVRECMGYDPSEVIGKTPFDLMAPEEAQRVGSEFRALAAERAWLRGLEGTLRSRDGRALVFEMNAVPVLDDAGRFHGYVGTCRDITVRKQGERALQCSEMAKSLLLDAMAETFAWSDPDLRVRWANHAAAASVGERVEDIVGRYCYQVWHGRQEPCENCPALVARDSGLPQQAEITTPDGRVSHLRVFPIKDQGGAVIALAEFGQDITQHRDVARALAESEARFRTMVDASPIGVFLVRDGRFIYANPAGVAIMGLEAASEVAGLPIERAIAPEQMGFVRRRLARALAGDANPPMELSIMRSDGTRCLCESTSVPIRLRDGPAVLVMSANITERRRAEGELREREARLVSIFRAAPVGIGATHGRVILDANDTLCRMTGYSRDELIGRDARLLYLTDDDYEYVGREKHRLLRAHGVGTVETRWRRKDGAVIHIILSSTSLDPSGTSAGITFTALDITERKRREAVLEARLRLSEYARHASATDLLRMTLDEAESLTGSRIGFCHLLEEDQLTLESLIWSTNTLNGACRVGATRAHYGLEEAGVWADCVRERQPVIHNDYASLPHHKGLPTGHVQVARDLAVPIMRGDRIVAVLGVGNKSTDYDERDVEAISVLADLAWDITERQRAEQALRASLQEKEVLLREVHHRVKNNLAAVNGLVELQQDGIDDSRVAAMLAALSGRIRSMALVHEMLYQSETISRIDLDAYLEALVGQVCAAYDPWGDVEVAVHAPGVSMDLDTAMPCGLIVNELVTNALKYAFPREAPAGIPPSRRIVVSVSWDGARYTLSVADNGVGLPEDVDWLDPKTLGLGLVRMLAEHQLRGAATLRREAGAQFVLTFGPRHATGR